jgi:lipopolysaccharide assembly protein A
MRLIYRAIFIVVAIFLISFAVSNRTPVLVGLWPLPFLANVPLYLLCLFSVLIGALIGAVAVWIAARPDRRKLRKNRWHIEALKRELAATQSQLADHSDTPRAALPENRKLS